MSLSSFISQEQIAAVRKPLEEASLLPFNCYSDPAFYRFEVEQVFMRTWQAVGRIDQVAEVGQYFTRELFGEPIVVVRGEDGQIHALSNVCRHRGRQVMEGAGKCRKHMVCPYHAWAYETDGQLAHVPHMEKTAHFATADWRLPRLGVDVWQGFIFINFDAAAEPLSPQLKTLDALLEPYNMAEMGCVDFARYQGEWNWKATMDNFSEAYHQPPIHTETFEPWCPAVMAQYDDVDGPYNLFWMPTGNGERFPTPLPAIEGLPERYYQNAIVINVFPHFHLLIDSSSAMWLDWDIRGVNDHDLVWRLVAPRSTLAAADFAERKQALYGALRPVWEEDEFACRGHARGVGSRFIQQGRMSYMEKALHQYHNWLLDQYQQQLPGKAGLIASC
ncbi:aromatic ring-hydroxylating oxygenase subunit alpha [Pseudomonas citronellolis]|uniref:aromatic ring-hydroxylating oxygenase subunit alpha n=1 Tax=Pseudomonas citronellolis TaxID=53408 RepID=UPI00209F0A84|nr:aromatic ring-hydroxylating dioxygenase subunit alpha [Pseudomonas citronellolis]MCP1605997.1 nitrite reductase/ring-hydroxylating ferredoxin subunit [Pseudomonas citronellolis]MCP1656593.1 nitrite reductase/ring-hydroxylating ferredoxin subunit [Pseudomonas citronellolis]MCP1723622.1 nitrite reductase/ring-hydroxylating ferredoxin subunit [Pseudomonas citronellolis]WAB92988.1 aromatic ring-hydroxylating dioxygenase subunit alpha [Pseudomonas citronellolis]